MMGSAPAIAILGGGAVTQEYYLPALSALGWLDRCCVVDIHKGNAAAIRRSFPTVDVRESDYRSFMDQASLVENFQAAVVSLPNSLHEAAVSASLERNLDVLCEKPLVLSGEKAVRLHEAAEKSGRLLWVGMTRRHLPSVVALRDCLRQGWIGELRGIEIEDGSPYSWVSDSGLSFRRENGGVLSDMGVHYLDLLRYLFGDLSPVDYRDDWEGGVETNAEYRLTAAGAPVRLALSWTRPLANTLIVRGSSGSLEIKKDVFDGCFFRQGKEGLWGKIRIGKVFDSGPWPPSYSSCFIEQFFRFGRSLKERSRPPVETAESVSVCGLLEWAYDKRKEKRPAASPVGPAFPSSAGVVVTGGTGFIGSHVVERLHQWGVRGVRVPVRRFKTAADIARFPVEMTKTDLLDYDQVRCLVKGARYVFHLAYGRDGKDGEKITVEGTRHVLRASEEAGVECVVVLSTAAVFGLPDSGPVDENFPYRPRLGRYGKSKAAMEKECLRFSGKTRVAVLNPTCVYGPRGKAYTEMPADLASEGSFCWFEDGGAANFTYAGNLVDAMILAAQNPQAAGRRFIINDGTATWKEFLSPVLAPWLGSIPSFDRGRLQALYRQSQKKAWAGLWKSLLQNKDFRRQLGEIEALAAPKAWVVRFFPSLRGTGQSSEAAAAGVSSRPSDPPVPPLWLGELFGASSTVFCADRAKTVLGWTPRVPLESGQSECVRWLESMKKGDSGHGEPFDQEIL